MLGSRIDLLRKSAELHSPQRVLDEQSAMVVRLGERLDTLVKGRVDGADARFRTACARLEGVNPLAVLSHGYAIVENKDGKIISGIGDVSVGDMVEISLSDGVVQAEITNISEKARKVNE